MGELEDILLALSKETETLSGISISESKQVFDECYMLLQRFLGLAEAYKECFTRRDVLLQQKQEQFKKAHQTHRAALKSEIGQVMAAMEVEELLESRRRFADYCIYR